MVDQSYNNTMNYHWTIINHPNETACCRSSDVANIAQIQYYKWLSLL
jgi:hypothetical protein